MDDREAELERILVGGLERRRIVIVDHDPAWADRFGAERVRIAAALGPVARSIEHVGSTSVPGLAAKPIVDIAVTVDDPSHAERYEAPLLAAGYELRVREPDHRMYRTPAGDVHVHVWRAGSEEARTQLLLRDWLRRSPEDRARYEGVKRELAQREWRDMNHYADAKTGVITEILARAERWAAAHPPPRPLDDRPT